MNPDEIRLTDAEWSVMDCLWRKSPRTGRELVGELHDSMGWSRSTVLTLLSRLEHKGAVQADSSGRIKQYRPCIAHEDAARQETQSLIQRAYRGSLSLLVSTLTQKQSLPQAEIDELYAILDGLEADSHE